MQYTLTIGAKGESLEDLAIALEEMIRLIEEGFSSGENSNETGSFAFSIHHAISRPCQ